MITCVLYDEADVDGFPVGGSGAEFNFDTLPRLGDILWLHILDNNNQLKEVVCTVVFAARRSASKYISYSYSGYLVVRMDTDHKYGGYDDRMRSVR
jgi:hypothetical protein